VLGWAESIGLNTMRVFLHNLLWQQDATGFQKRIDTFLSIAAKHHMRILFVLFDSVWDPNPHLGKQRAPTGKTQTYLPWDSWEQPYIDHQPKVWFHEIFRTDGTAYREEEVSFIERLTAENNPMK
jgi:hypothetical protein